MGTIYHVAILVLQLKPQDVIFGSWISIYEPRQKIVLTDSRLSSPSRRNSRNCPLDRQGRSTDVDYNA